MSKIKLVYILAALLTLASENSTSFNAVATASSSVKFVLSYPGSRFLDTAFTATKPGISLLRCGIECGARPCAYFQFVTDTTTTDYGTCQIGDRVMTASSSTIQEGKNTNTFIFLRTSTPPSATPTSAPSNDGVKDKEVQTTRRPLNVQTKPAAPMLIQPTTSASIGTTSASITSAVTSPSTVATASAVTSPSNVATTSIVASPSSEATTTTILTTASTGFSTMSNQNSTFKQNPVDQGICNSIQTTTTWNCNCSTSNFCQGVLQCQITVSTVTTGVYLNTTSAATDRFTADDQCDTLGMNMLMTKSLESLNAICHILYYAVGPESNASYWMGASKSTNTSAVWLYDDGTALDQTMIDLITNDTSTGGSSSDDGDYHHRRHKRGGSRRDRTGGYDRDHVHDHGDDTTIDDQCVIIAGYGYADFFLEISNCSVTGYAGSQNSPYQYICEP